MPYDGRVGMSQTSARLVLHCAQCGSEFFLYPSQIDHDRGKYCSKQCFHASLRRGHLLFCAMCDIPFYKQLAEQDSSRHFCSRPCYMLHRSANMHQQTYPKIGAQHAHRKVAEEMLCRALHVGEVVHHIDLNRHNTVPENLAVFPSQSKHMRCHYGKMTTEELSMYTLTNGVTG